MKNKVSVVVTTRNRENDLKHCLGSLACQLEIIDELIVIDNNSSDGTARVVENFSKAVNFKVHYVKHTKVGYPHVYNRGLREAKGDWVAFIDDDCIADPNWYKRIKLVTTHFPKLSVILGSVNEYHIKSTAALTKFYIDEVGKLGVVKNKLILDHEILDSKNIIYNKFFLDNNGIQFDVNLLKYAQGASEDCDLGMQIYSFGGLAIYDEKIKITHKDPTSLLIYYKKLFFTLRNHLVYEVKWSNVRKNIHTKRLLVEKYKLFIDFREKYSLNVIKTFLVLINIFLTFLSIKLFRLVLKTEINKMKIRKVQ